MNDNSSGGKMSFIYFYSLKFKGNCAHLAEKHPRPGAKIPTIIRLS